MDLTHLNCLQKQFGPHSFDYLFNVEELVQSSSEPAFSDLYSKKHDANFMSFFVCLFAFYELNRMINVSDQQSIQLRTGLFLLIVFYLWKFFPDFFVDFSLFSTSYMLAFKKIYALSTFNQYLWINDAGIYHHPRPLLSQRI